MKKVCTSFLAMGIALLAVNVANAIATRHDRADSTYIVADKNYSALVNLFEPNDCIGTLIHPIYLLTVAHCTTDLAEGQSLKVKGVLQVIAKIIPHARWREGRDRYDIALVRLTKPVTTVTPLPIYRKANELGSRIILVGRGAHATGLRGERGAKSDGKLRQATNIVSMVNRHFLEVIFERAGQKGVTRLEGVGLSGDSGGPAFIKEGGKLYIAGLNSYGDAEGKIRVGQYGSRDYQTRISQYLKWLDSVIGRK